MSINYLNFKKSNTKYAKIKYNLFFLPITYRNEEKGSFPYIFIPLKKSECITGIFVATFLFVNSLEYRLIIPSSIKISSTISVALT